MSASGAEQPPAALDRSPGLDKQSIVSAALDIIAERGVPGLSMRLLSQRLGVSLGATYRHVPNKNELLRLVARELYARINPADDSADEFEQAKQVMLQIHGLLAAYPGMAAHIAEHVPQFYSASVAGLMSGPLQAAGVPRAEADRTGFAAAAFEAGVDLILRGARTRSQHR